MDYCTVLNTELDGLYYVDKLIVSDAGGTSVYLGSLTNQPLLQPKLISDTTPTATATETAPKKPQSVKIIRLDVFRTRTEQRMKQICLTVRAKFPNVGGIVLVFRIGDLQPLDYYMFIGITAQSQEESVHAVDLALAEMNKLPVWREEVYADGSRCWTSSHECFWRASLDEREMSEPVPRKAAPPAAPPRKYGNRGHNPKVANGKRMYAVKTTEDGQIVRNVPESSSFRHVVESYLG
ncbi:hypothetical protein BV898_11828 [Hypsibius exemplaris]|uniref:Molybdopterin synthase catalytic subunit n=1 Tax=Hypsibius exemplaris TaxID=2072580 RepID=A0A1W0WFF5_HYPEX|nr:hypothetical protein BV898_11828 [Hypsibius exemplaris]